MADNTSGSAKKQNKSTYKNTFEAIKSLGASTGQNTDELIRQYQENYFPENNKQADKTKNSSKDKSNLFSFQEHHENSIVKKQIQELTQEVKREIDLVKRADRSLMSEVKDIEKLTIDSLPEKPGIYHVRFLEVVLSILKLIKAKINESSTWLNAMRSKRKKRGSLFAARSKEKGTQYSLSEEMKVTRQTG